MGAREAASRVTQEVKGAVTHPRRTAGEVVGGARFVAGVGAGLAGRVVGSVAGIGDRLLGLERRSEQEHLAATTDPPGRLREEATRGVATPAPKPAPPTQPRSAEAPGEEVRTPSGIEAADEGHNPDTAEADLHQPGTEPLVDPATAKSVRSEADTLRRGARRDKG